MKKSILRIFNYALTVLLTLVGFTHCEEPEVEYGVPNSKYTVVGTVTDKSTSKPIKGIRIGFKPYTDIMLMYGVMPVEYYSNMADTSDIDGFFKLSDRFYIGEVPDDKIYVYVEDVDGTENGWYRDTIITADYKDIEPVGKATGWYNGEYIINTDIELTQRQSKDD